MFDDMKAAIDAAYGGQALDEISATIWQAAGAGTMAEEVADALLQRIASRRAAGAARKSESAIRRPNTLFPPRRPQRPPVRAVAIERRRRVAASGALPPPVAARFTLAEQAVLAVVIGQVLVHGDCRLPIDAIAAIAGCSRSSTKNAIRAAVRLGVVRITVRPVRGARNLPNVIEVTDQAVIAWMKRRARNPSGGYRGQNSDPHEYKKKKGLSERRGVGVSASPQRSRIDRMFKTM